MPSVPEELDVFRLPHSHMKKLLDEVKEHLSCTNFSDGLAYHSLLDHLYANFQQFKSHEDIENRYILDTLLSRLPTTSQTHLHNDLHSDNRLAEIVILVRDGLELECSAARDRVAFGERLKKTISNFAVDFVPHMEEEEEVFLPLLLKYFSEPELKSLTETVIQLHHLEVSIKRKSLKEEGSRCQSPSTVAGPSLLNLPPEILLRVFSVLSPADLCRLSQVHSSLHPLAFDGSLWRHLHPVRWARGTLCFFTPPLLGAGEREEEGEAVLELVAQNDVTKERLSMEAGANANLCRCSYAEERDDAAYLESETRRLRAMVEHLLPRVGPHVLTLDLAHGTAVTNEVVFRMLRQCPSLRYLDVSCTKVSDFAFRGLLGPDRSLWQLEYINLTGCTMITDVAMQRLSKAIASHPSPHHTYHPSPPHASHSVTSQPPRTLSMHTSPAATRAVLRDGGGVGGGGEGRRGVEGGDGWRGRMVEPQLVFLILSGCKLITDNGLRSLAGEYGLPRLRYLDLSGLAAVTERGLDQLVSACPALKPELLFYCDNILEGPYADVANGCQNVGSPGLCCRQTL